jgi:ribosome-associated translation inhibitor RaiA
MEWIDFLRIVEWPFIMAMAGILWRLNQKMTDLNSTVSQKLSDHQVHVAEQYAKKADVEKTETKIYSVLDRIEKKLDRTLERSKQREED